MSEPQTPLWYLERAVILFNEGVAQVQHAYDAIRVMDPGGARPERVLCCSPVTGRIEPGENSWGGDWFDATGYSTLYGATGKSCYHTGADLNRPNFADSGAPVYAAADGEIVFSGAVQGWQGSVIVQLVTLEDGQRMWLRYAHISALIKGTVRRGQQIATIADYNKDGPKGDHLHFDIAHIDLNNWPGDWPGLDVARLKRDYADPAQWLKERAA